MEGRARRRSNNTSGAGLMARLADIVRAAFAKHYPCDCAECRALDRAHPREGVQLRLLRSLGDQPDAIPLTVSEAPAVAPARVRKPKAAQSESALAAAKAGGSPAMTAMTTIEKTPTKRGRKLPPTAATATEIPAASVPAIGVIIPSAPKVFPLHRLVRAPENVRHTRIDEDVSTLADDIIAHGLLQSLIGYEEGDLIYIVGGGRRLQALDSIATRGLIGDDFPVPVLVRGDDEALELSLAENLQQRTMSPVDEFFAFKALMDMGTNSPATLAKRFGFSERVVKQRLRLADLAEPVLDALVERKITIDAAMAYASSQDRTLQAEIFKAHNRPNAWEAHKPDKVRRDLRGKGMDTGDQLFRYVGADAYERRGGGYEDDLFNEEGAERVLTHAHLVEGLAQDHIDFQMIRRLREFQEREDLAPSIAGYVKVPDARLANWGTNAKLTAPAGFVKVDKWDHAKLWNTIRNNGIPVQILVGVNPEGELAVWPRIVFVTKEQKEAIDPTVSGGGYVAPTPEEEAAAERKREVELWSRRFAVPKFAGTFFEGRAFWPDRWDDHSKPMIIDGVSGMSVTVQIFVPNTAISAAVPEAEARYERELATKAEREAADRAAEEAAEARKEQLLAGEEAAVVVIDGQAWLRAEDGSYAAQGDADSCESWSLLIECANPAEIGPAYPTVTEFEAAMLDAAAAAEARK